MFRVWNSCCLLLCCGCILYTLAFSSKKEPKKPTKEESEKKINETISALLEVMDKDNDDKVNEVEMIAWVSKTLRKMYKEDSKEFVATFDTDKDSMLSWEEYLKSEEDAGASSEEQQQRRFDFADADKDGHLNHDELTSMLHPEERPHMFDVVTEEYMEAGDKNGDGFLSLEEYKEKVFKGKKEDLEAADRFYVDNDRNEDGSLDREEIKEWIKSISTSSLAERQAKQVLKKADDNKDGAITDDEILKNLALFQTFNDILESEKKKNETAEKAKDEL